MKLHRLLIATFIIYTCLISYLSLKPLSGPADFQIWDKAAHAIAYIGFAILSSLLARNKKQLISLYSFCFSFGIAIELLQGQTGYRFASWEDHLANTIGLLTGFILFAAARYLIPKKQPK